MKLTCPHCTQVAFDADTGQCTNCHMRGGDIAPVITDVVLEGLLCNARNVLGGLLPHEFVQLLGAFSPRVGHSPNDGIPFDAQTAERVWRHLRSHTLLCLWIVITADNHSTHSLILANTSRGLERGLTAARKVARKIRGRLIVKDTTDA